MRENEKPSCSGLDTILSALLLFENHLGSTLDVVPLQPALQMNLHYSFLPVNFISRAHCLHVESRHAWCMGGPTGFVNS